jgi:hypothetical protein
VLRVPGNAGMRETEKAARGSISARLVKILAPAAGKLGNKTGAHSKFVHCIYREMLMVKIPVNDQSIHVGFTGQPCKRAHTGGRVESYIAVQ